MDLNHYELTLNVLDYQNSSYYTSIISGLYQMINPSLTLVLLVKYMLMQKKMLNDNSFKRLTKIICIIIVLHQFSFILIEIFYFNNKMNFYNLFFFTQNGLMFISIGEYVKSFNTKMFFKKFIIFILAIVFWNNHKLSILMYFLYATGVYGEKIIVKWLFIIYNFVSIFVFIKVIYFINTQQLIFLAILLGVNLLVMINELYFRNHYINYLLRNPEKFNASYYKL